MARGLIALSVGLGLGAVVLSGYAFARRVPGSLTSDNLGSLTRLLGWSLALACLTTIALAAVGMTVLAGRDAASRAALLLTAALAVTFYGYLGSWPAEGAALIAVPGSHPVVPLGQVSWALLALAAALLLAGAVAGRGQRRVPWRAILSPLTALGLIVAVASGCGVVALSGLGAARASTAAPIGIPEIPRTLGDRVAFSLTTGYAGDVVPAGPGFVMYNDGALVGYDGTSGQPRWRFPLQLLPNGCGVDDTRSTGTAPGAVVVVQCLRRVDWLHGDSKDPLLVGLDAMTGQVLWANDQHWFMQGRAVLSPAGVPVLRGDDLAMLDTRTGLPRWVRPLSEDARCTRDQQVGSVERGVVYVASCGDTAAVHVLDGQTGDDRTIQLPPPTDGTPTDDLSYELAATDADVVAFLVQGYRTDYRALLAVRTGSGDIATVRHPGYPVDVASFRSGQYPGPVLQLDDGVKPEDFTNLYLMARNLTIHARGVRIYQAADVSTRQRWAVVGDHIVTAAAMGNRDQNYAHLLVTVSADGTTSQRPSPCGRDTGGIVAAPGSVLVLCVRGKNDGYDVLGLR
ncbi:hypothetical protein BKN37_12850 [Mycobacterium talmoniae]|uniref:Pyrrolo-quinoline quinone repeat domain-containing protein n=1 Tax=Mycobacterium talmoniae TaxID=1858794 RepID=A0A1S1NIF8_9MYCO|nr:hypothetical protein BKN37_12850 [Mycobacterium talmoniae]